MKCIDAIEGAVKCILEELHANYAKSGSDDSEYIQHAKSVIDATDRYVQNNPELIKDPDLLKQVLYVYSRNLWIIGQQPSDRDRAAAASAPSPDLEDYQTYYYDYLYKRGVYPS